ncbi:MAG: ester cyclase [Candidatus Zixiibacteriota bacterium]
MRCILIFLGIVAIFAGDAICGDDVLEANKKLTAEYILEAWNGEITDFDSYFADTVDFNGMRIASKSLGEMVKEFKRSFSDISVKVDRQIAEGDYIVTMVTFTATHDGEFAGIPPTGKRITYKGVGIDRIENGKVIEMWHQFDTGEVMQMLLQ